MFVYLLYQSCNPTPLLLDTDGDGFRLTGPAAGVRFDFSGKGKLTRTGWTAAGSDDAFLALDRNANGKIDDGTELFGNHALQPSRGKLPKNGFHALAEFDKADNGGNGDGVISAGDAVFGSLLLWTDKNHNALSEPDELRPYADAGATAISLTMWPTKVADAHGNWFRWVSRLEGAEATGMGGKVFDVIFATEKRPDARPLPAGTEGAHHTTETPIGITDDPDCM